MVQLHNDSLIFSFKDVHQDAVLGIDFQRTLRIPDDNRKYPLPPGLGSFPLKVVDDFRETVPPGWVERGGIFLPMYQSEAMWMSFDTFGIPDRGTSYPFAIKIGAGKINAVTGESWSNELDTARQDYLVSPVQPWLDGYCVEEGIIRQFVAMPLGAGYTAEEQLTGKGEYGGIQIVVYPMKREVFERRFPKQKRDARQSAPLVVKEDHFDVLFAMGLAPGGRMRQKIYDDPFGVYDWDQNHRSRCFVHIANSTAWRSITGDAPPTVLPTAKTYTAAGLPWFEYYSDIPAVDGSAKLNGLKSVALLAKVPMEWPLPENESADPDNVVGIAGETKGNQVREGIF